MSGAIVKGWCPSAYRPMLSGDGLLVRVKPRLARLTAAQATALPDLANRFGNGVIDLTSRANLQLRGVTEADHAALLEALLAADLIDPDPQIEERRAIVTAPFWQAGDRTERLTLALTARLADFPDLPGKMGFAVDAGRLPMLTGVSGDIRFETSDAGLILRAEGARLGRVVEEDAAIDAAIELAEWFVDTGGRERGRMARHLAHHLLPKAWQTAEPAPSMGHPIPGPAIGGHVVGVPFGAIEADDFAALIDATDARHIRVTPWRLLFLENAARPAHPAFIHTPGDPLLDVAACPGTPRCSSAEVETRPIARRLAEKVQGTLHVSGCAKGCARRNPAAVTLVGQGGRFDLVENGRASDTPCRTGLTEADLMELFP